MVQNPNRSFLLVWIVTGLVVILCLSVSKGRSESPFATDPSIDFENRDLGSWKLFQTPNGTVGGTGFPQFVSFETREPGSFSQGLQFKVGQARFQAEERSLEGGGLETQIQTTDGLLVISANVAVTYRSLIAKDRRNLAGGQFDWVVNDRVTATYDAGPIDKGATLRHRFRAQIRVSAGPQRIQLRMTRPFSSVPGQAAPFQIVDDLHFQFFPQP